MSARLIEVIETNLELRGEGTVEDPFRRIRQYWSKDGELLAEVDVCKENKKEETK